MKIDKRIVVSADGCPLMLQRAEGAQKTGVTVLLGHGPSVNTRLMAPAIATLCAAGAVVYAGDLRGHGASISGRAPKAHLDPDTGWQHLLADMRCFADQAFADVPRDKRLLLGGGLSGHLMLDLLRDDPATARHLIMAGPTPPQKGVGKVLEGFLRVRRLTRPIDAPDPQLLHHIYRFLRAQISSGVDRDTLAMLETVTADADQIARIMADPTGFPTPTLGYWLATLPGIQASWLGQGADLPADLRVMILSGPEDPQTHGGRLMPKITAALQARGPQDIALRLLPQVRANILIDAEQVPVAQTCLDWMAGQGGQMALTAPPQAGVAPVASMTMPMDLTGMIAKCYAAIDDDSHWIDLIIGIAHAAEGDDPNIDAMIETLHPHWQRAFELREELRWAARMGRVYHDVIDRLDLGVALLDGDGQLGHANPAYKRIIARLMQGSDANLARVTARLLAEQQKTRPSPGKEVPLLLEGRVIGLWMHQDQGEATGGLLVLRDPDQARDQTAAKSHLMMLAYGLTQKESMVALMLADGLSTADAATRLAISEHTLRSHVKSVFDKMQITSRAELSHRILSGPLGWLSQTDQAALPPDRVMP
jgi:alpha-beta hydrolase superfamily lysophospholipase/DNA-binding CsgD family transcriptional regulator